MLVTSARFVVLNHNEARNVTGVHAIEKQSSFDSNSQQIWGPILGPNRDLAGTSGVATRSAGNSSSAVGWPTYVAKTLTTTPPGGIGGVKWGLFLSVLLWANGGYDEAGGIAGDVKDPARSYSRGVLATVVLVALIYLLPIGFGVCVLPWEQWDGSAFTKIAQTSAAGLGSSDGGWLRAWIAIAAAAGCFGTYVSLVCATSRGLKCLADLKFIPSLFAWEHPRLRTPIPAILCNCLISAGLCYFDFSIVVQIGVVLYAAALFLEWGSVLLLRFREPNMKRPFVIPLRNGMLLVYLSIPMALCAVTVYQVFSEAVLQLESSDSKEVLDGKVTLVGSVASFVLALLIYCIYRIRGGGETDLSMLGSEADHGDADHDASAPLLSVN